MQIFVKNLSGKTIAVDTNLGNSVAAVKTSIERKEGICWRFIGLRYGGKTLQNHHSLEKEGVKEESTLDLVLQLKGGTTVLDSRNNFLFDNQKSLIACSSSRPRSTSDLHKSRILHSSTKADTLLNTKVLISPQIQHSTPTVTRKMQNPSKRQCRVRFHSSVKTHDGLRPHTNLFNEYMKDVFQTVTRKNGITTLSILMHNGNIVGILSIRAMLKDLIVRCNNSPKETALLLHRGGGCAGCITKQHLPYLMNHLNYLDRIIDYARKKQASLNLTANNGM